uniref:Uncharacterized protein n=1 Tax=viral metagenome TaxID=1070528 RepID=A0A6C0LY72_9ZZZZ
MCISFSRYRADDTMSSKLPNKRLSLCYSVDPRCISYNIDIYVAMVQYAHVNSLIATNTVLNEREYTDEEMDAVYYETVYGECFVVDHMLETPESDRMTAEELDREIDMVSMRNAWLRWMCDK